VHDASLGIHLVAAARPERPARFDKVQSAFVDEAPVAGIMDQPLDRGRTHLAHWCVPAVCIAYDSADLLHWSATVRFITSFLAIVPLAKVCTRDYIISRAAGNGRRCDCG